MYNRAACGAARNIRDNMGKSRKKVPSGTWTPCKSRKKGKQFSHRRFRRCEKMAMVSGKTESLPFRQVELTCTWDLGGDGKWCNWGIIDDEWKRYMRK